MASSFSSRRGIGRVLSAPVRWIVAPIQRLTRNWRYGKVRNLLLGLPAVAALFGFLALSALVRANPESVRRMYFDRANEAIAAEQYERAEIYLQRILTDLDADDKDTRFRLGQVYEETGRPERADTIYRQLAPDNGAGHDGAHGERAAALAATLSNPPTGEELRLLKFHLDHAEKPVTGDVAAAMATYYSVLGDREEAIRWLEEAKRTFPALNRNLAAIYASMEENERAEEAFIAFKDYLVAEFERDETSHTVRITLADTWLRLGELDECERLLREGLTLYPDGPYQQLLALYYVQLHDMGMRQGHTVPQRYAVLRLALDLDPVCAPAYERLLLYAEVPIDPENPDAGTRPLEEVLTELIAQGEHPGFAHFAMSMLKWGSDESNRDVAASRQHLEMAHRLLPEMPFITNNLAFLLATEEPIDLDRALELMNPTVESFPYDPRLLDTRATIYMQLGRWQEAYDDLSAALEALNNAGPSQARADLHKKLADVCDQLGLTDLAVTHRRLASEDELALPETPTLEKPELVPPSEIESPAAISTPDAIEPAPEN